MKSDWSARGKRDFGAMLGTGLNVLNQGIGAAQSLGLISGAAPAAPAAGGGEAQQAANLQRLYDEQVGKEPNQAKMDEFNRLAADYKKQFGKEWVPGGAASQPAPAAGPQPTGPSPLIAGPTPGTTTELEAVLVDAEAVAALFGVSVAGVIKAIPALTRVLQSSDAARSAALVALRVR